MALKSRVGNLSLPVVFGAGAAGGLPGLAVAAGTQVIRFLLGSGRGRVPARAAEEASNQIRSSTAPKVWVVGRARVGTALVGHYDLVDPVVAAAYFEQADVTDVLGREQPDQVLLRRQRADRRMSLWSYYIWCIAEGSVEAVEDLWINGVLLNAAHTSGPSASDVGELAVPVNPLADAEWSPHEPFWVPQFLPKTKGPVVIEGAGQAVYDSDDPGDAPAYWVPSCAFWVSRGDEPAHLDPTDTNGALALRKVREVVNASNSTDAEKADIAASEGLTPTWVLGRFLNTWATRADRPWRGVPEVEALVRGRGPWFDFGEGAGPEPLLDGNIAKWAFWVLRYRLGVPLAHIDLPTLRHSVLDCQASEVVLAVTDTPTPASLAEARAFVSDIEAGAGQGSGAARQRFDTLAPDEQRRGEALLARLMQWLDEVGERPGATKLTPWYVGLSLDAKARLYHRWRVKVVVEQATGRPWGETTGTARARILAQWRKRFTGTADDSDGVRRRYWGGGVVPADSDWRAVLAELARSMAGSIEEHGGTWYIRSGTSTFRPSATITDADLRGGLPNQVLEPSLAEQPTEVRAAIAQDETAEFERHVLAPIRRDDANLGDVLADSQPAVVKVAELGFTLQEWAALTPGERVQAEASRRRVLDMGVLAYVTNPHQAAQLQRIALYQTRASTRTISLVVGFGKDFQFLKLGKGFPVSVSLDHAGVHGDVVGERRPALRCVVVEPPEVDWDAETVQLTLRQQDADAFGERHGLVFDYQDSPDVLLVGGVYTPTEDLSCSFPDWSAEPGASISRSDRWQVNVSGAVGAVQVSLNHQPGDPVFLAVDSDTGIVTGVLPAGRQGAFYVVHAVVRDEAGRVATCSARLHVGVVPAPEVRFDPPRPQAQRGASGSCRAYVHCSDDVGRIWDDACAGRWTFSLVSGPSWMSMSGDVLSWNVPADQPAGYVSARVRATASDGRSVGGAVALLVYVEGVFEAVCRRPVRVTLGVPVSVDLVERMSGHEGSVSATYPSQVGGGFRIPPGLALSADNKRLTGTIPDTPTNRSRLVGAYQPFRLDFEDSASPPRSTSCTSQIVVSATPEGSCSLPPVWRIPQSGKRSIKVEIDGFTGTPNVLLTDGPCYLSLRQSAGEWWIDAADGSAMCPREPGESTFGVVVSEPGASTRCRTRLVVEEEPTTPPDLVPAGGTVNPGADWADSGGGCSVRPGTGEPPFSFAVDDAARMLRETGAVLSSAGALSGTALQVEGVWAYDVTVTDANDDMDTDSLQLVVKRHSVNEYCYDGVAQPDPAVPSVVVRDRPYCTLTARGTPTLGAKTGPWADWGATLVQAGSSAYQPATGQTKTTWAFRAVVPAGQKAGPVSFVQEMQDSQGFTQRIRITVNVVAVRPLACGGLNILVNRNESFRRDLGGNDADGNPFVSGGDEGQAPVFSDWVGLPTWFNFTSAGVMSFAGQNDPKCATPLGEGTCWSGVFSFLLTRGAVSKSFRVIWRIRRGGGGGGGGGGPPDDEETLA